MEIKYLVKLNKLGTNITTIGVCTTNCLLSITTVFTQSESRVVLATYQNGQCYNSSRCYSNRHSRGGAHVSIMRNPDNQILLVQFAGPCLDPFKVKNGASSLHLFGPAWERVMLGQANHTFWKRSQNSDLGIFINDYAHLTHTEI